MARTKQTGEVERRIVAAIDTIVRTQGIRGLTVPSIARGSWPRC